MSETDSISSADHQLKPDSLYLSADLENDFPLLFADPDADNEIDTDMTSSFGKQVDQASLGVTPPAKFLDLMLVTTRMLNNEAERLQNRLGGENVERQATVTSFPSAASEIITQTSDLTADMMIKAMQVAEVRKLRRENALETVEMTKDSNRQVADREVSMGQASQSVSTFTKVERDLQGDRPEVNKIDGLSLATRLRLMNALEALAQLHSKSQENDLGKRMASTVDSSDRVSDLDDGAGDADDEDGKILVVVKEDGMMPGGEDTEVEVKRNPSNPTVAPPEEVKKMVNMMHGVLPEFNRTIQGVREMFTYMIPNSQNGSSSEEDRLFRIFYRVNGNATDDRDERVELFEDQVSDPAAMLPPSRTIQEMTKQLDTMLPESSSDVVIPKATLRNGNNTFEKLVAHTETQVMKPVWSEVIESTRENKRPKLQLSDMVSKASQNDTNHSLRLHISDVSEVVSNENNTLHFITKTPKSPGKSVDVKPNITEMNPVETIVTSEARSLQGKLPMEHQNMAQLLSSIPLAMVVKLEQVPIVMSAILSIMNRELTTTSAMSSTDLDSMTTSSPSLSTPGQNVTKSSVPPESMALSELLRRVEQEMKGARGEENRGSKVSDEESEFTARKLYSKRPLFERLRRPETTTRPPEPGQARQRLGTTLADVLRQITLRPDTMKSTTTRPNMKEKTVTRSFIIAQNQARPATRKQTFASSRYRTRLTNRGKNSTHNGTRATSVSREMTTARFLKISRPVAQELTSGRPVSKRRTTARRVSKGRTAPRDFAPILPNPSNETVQMISTRRAQIMEHPRSLEVGTGMAEPPVVMQKAVMRNTKSLVPNQGHTRNIGDRPSIRDASQTAMDTPQWFITDGQPEMDTQPPTPIQSRLATLLSQLSASRRGEQEPQRVLSENEALKTTSVFRTLSSSRSTTSNSDVTPASVAVRRLKALEGNQVPRPPERNHVPRRGVVESSATKHKRTSGIQKGAGEELMSLAEKLRMRLLEEMVAQEKLKELANSNDLRTASTTPRVSIARMPSKSSNEENVLSSKQKMLVKWGDQLRKQLAMKLSLNDLPEDISTHAPAIPKDKISLQIADPRERSQPQPLKELSSLNILRETEKKKTCKASNGASQIAKTSASASTSTTELEVAAKHKVSLGDRLIERLMSSMLSSSLKTGVKEMDMVSSPTHIPIISSTHGFQLDVRMPKTSILGVPLVPVKESTYQTPAKKRLTSDNPFPGETVRSVLQRLTIPHRTPAKLMASLTFPFECAKTHAPERKHGLFQKWRQLLNITASNGHPSSDLIAAVIPRVSKADTISQAVGKSAVKASRPSVPGLAKDRFSSLSPKSTTMRSPFWPANDRIPKISHPANRFRSPSNRAASMIPTSQRQTPPPIFRNDTDQVGDDDGEEAEANLTSAADGSDLSSSDTERRVWVWNSSPRRPATADRLGWRWQGQPTRLLPLQYNAPSPSPPRPRSESAQGHRSPSRPRSRGGARSVIASRSRQQSGRPSAISDRSDGVGESPVLPSRYQQYHVLDRPYDFTDRSPDRPYPVVYIQGFG